MTEESKWIRFQLADKQNPKTKIWNVITKEDNFILGQIKWFGIWRQYAFFPVSDTVYEKICLNDISNFLKEQTINRKQL